MPKIGTFTLQHTPARYDVTDNTIEAPGQKIIFETTWTDDGRCVDWIAQKEHLMPSIARLKMDKYIDELKATLQTGRAMVIPGVGQLQANTIGIISFTPEPMPLTRETLHVKPVIRSDASHTITVGNTERVGQTVTNHLTASADHTADYNTPIEEYEAYPETPSGFRWWWVVAPVGSLLFAALIWYLAVKQDENANKNAAEAAAAVDTMQMKEEIKHVDTLPPAPPVSDTIEYYAVIETFNNKKEADKRYKLRKGWDSTVQLLYNNSSDSTHLKIAVPLRSAKADTTRLKDSVSKVFSKKAQLQF